MKRGTLISILVALIAITGALLGLVAYMRSRRCLECADAEEDYVPDVDTEGDYECDYYVERQEPAAQEQAEVHSTSPKTPEIESDEPME